MTLQLETILLGKTDVRITPLGLGIWQWGDTMMWGLDNLSGHKSEQARLMIEARGARLVFLAPYSPDFNPIELCWSKVKTALRAAKARTFDALLDALADALRSVSPADVETWFAHCGNA